MAKRPIFYDTETTGVKPDRDRITEIAAYDPVLGRSFNELVNPGVPIPEECVAITGITDEMVQDKESFAQVGERFFEFCSGDVILIAHNNDNFDRHFLVHESARHGLTLPSFYFIDTLKWARKYRPDLPRHSLQYLRELHGIPANNAHRALDDVIILHQVFTLMIDDLSYEDVYRLIYLTDNTIRQMPFGKHRGEALNKLPKTYLSWLAGSGALDKPENSDLKASLEKLGLLTNLPPSFAKSMN